MGLEGNFSFEHIVIQVVGEKARLLAVFSGFRKSSLRWEPSITGHVREMASISAVLQIQMSFASQSQVWKTLHAVKNFQCLL